MTDTAGAAAGTAAAAVDTVDAVTDTTVGMDRVMDWTTDTEADTVVTDEQGWQRAISIMQ